jgi:DNA-binding IclR family transcriptional regulator
LAEVCAQIRSQGFVLDEREFQDALRCVAAPVRDHDGAVIAYIGISAPAARMPEQLLSVRAGQVLEAAGEIHAALSMPARRGSSAANCQSQAR